MINQYCIITDDAIDRKNNSQAHVIPSALGGRLKPWGILSQKGNNLLGQKVDLPLIRAFQPLMTLLNGSRDRGVNQPVQMTDTNGRGYVVEFGKPLKLAQCSYQEETNGEETILQIEARTPKELRTLLGRAKRKYPKFDIDEAMKRAKTIYSWPDENLKAQLQIGPIVVFPAFFASASIFAVHHGHSPHPALKEYISGFDPNKPTLPPDTFYFISSTPWISAPGEVTHIVALLASAQQQKALVYFELFNASPVAVLLPYSGPEDVRATYAIDVLTGTEVQATINEEAIGSVPWEATYKLGDKEFYHFTTERIGRLIGLSQQRSLSTQIDQLVAHAFSVGDDKPLTPRDLINGIGEIVDFTLLEWRRPLTKIEDMVETLLKFDELCAGIENAIATSNRQSFRILIAPHRQKLEDAIDRKKAE